MARGFGGVSPVGRSQRLNTVVLGGVFLALICVGVAFLMLSSTPQQAAPSQPVVIEREAAYKTMDVLVPVADVTMGSPLEPGMFRKESKPAVAVDARSVKDFEEIKGYFARTLIVAGQPLHREMITSVRPANALTANIPDGFRAVTIRVDARTSVEGFTQPGAKVDVHWTTTIKAKPVVKVIVQNAKVLSAERQTDTAAKGSAVPSTVTLLVSDRDAGKIQLASTNGSLSLSLRGDSDPGKAVASDRVTFDDLLQSGDVDESERSEGSVIINGQRFNVLPGGKMVPAAR